MWNLIQEYEEANLPDDLGSRFDGAGFVVDVAVDTDGYVVCRYDGPNNHSTEKKHFMCRTACFTIQRSARRTH
jgi:hypothetical protein